MCVGEVRGLKSKTKDAELQLTSVCRRRALFSLQAAFVEIVLKDRPAHDGWEEKTPSREISLFLPDRRRSTRRHFCV